MAKMNINNYQPKYGQDPQLFNQMYMNYIDQLNSADSNVDYSEPDTPATQYSSGSRPISQQSSQVAEEDRDGQQEEDDNAQPKINFLP